jgi:hypothetical protein
VSVEKLGSLKFILHISYMGENLGMAPSCWVVWSREGGGISVERIGKLCFVTANLENFDKRLEKFSKLLKTRISAFLLS